MADIPTESKETSDKSMDGIIKEIDRESVKYIAAGQKIGDIESAIRELVENSIDAEAKNIEVRLSRFGIESIEVDDNGKGIDEKDFKTLGHRYHTSKISNYANLQESLQTFGFRGEALSCLCNIANVIITTKTKSSPTGTKLVFNKDGSLLKTEHVARTNGTTVTLKNLFHTMPVRRRELETTAKRQYDRVVKLLYEQVLARPHIKFSLCKKNSAKKEKDFTHGGTTLEGTIITIYGIKILESLIPIRQFGLPEIKIEDEQQEIIEIKKEEKPAIRTRASCKMQKPEVKSPELVKPVIQKDFETTKEPPRDEFFKRSRKSAFAREKPEYTIHGYISKLGFGRNSSDSQFLFVNKKPCDIPRVSKTINDFYRANSNGQFPFFTLFIQVQPWAADFNVPRKRAVILQDECKLTSIIRESLEMVFSVYAPGSQRSCSVAQIPMMVQKVKSDESDQKQGTKRELDKEPDNIGPMKKQQTSEEPALNIDPARVGLELAESASQPTDERASANTLTESEQVKERDVYVVEKLDESLRPSNYVFQAQEQTSPVRIDRPPNVDGNNTTFESALNILKEQQAKTKLDQQSQTEPDQQTISMESTPVDPIYDLTPESDLECRFEIKFSKKDNKMKVSMEHLDDLASALERERLQRSTIADAKEFSYAIHPNFNVVAEQELKFNLDKKSFQGMRVLGQFNKGFIITRLNKHVFIIDQHATDERANFEDQLKKSPLMKQPMVYPKPLYLNAIQENSIINHMDAFNKRGFEFFVDRAKPSGLRVQLTSTSICKGQGMDEHLTKEDVEELIDVITESPNQLATYTLKKVRNVAASRACRKSVMIGDKLNWNQMEEIVAKMANLQNPWVCAHNRPTIRHLMDTDWMD